MRVLAVGLAAKLADANPGNAQILLAGLGVGDDENFTLVVVESSPELALALHPKPAALHQMRGQLLNGLFAVYSKIAFVAASQREQQEYTYFLHISENSNLCPSTHHKTRPTAPPAPGSQDSGKPEPHTS